MLLSYRRQRRQCRREKSAGRPHEWLGGKDPGPHSFAIRLSCLPSEPIDPLRGALEDRLLFRRRKTRESFAVGTHEICEAIKECVRRTVTAKHAAVRTECGNRLTQVLDDARRSGSLQHTAD